VRVGESGELGNSEIVLTFRMEAHDALLMSSTRVGSKRFFMVVAHRLEWIVVGPSQQLSIMRGGAFAVGFAPQKGILAV